MKSRVSLKQSLYAVLGCSLLFMPNLASAISLRDIMQNALQYDPSLEEARANIAGAENQTKVSEAGHLPIISLSNTNVLAQKRTYTSDRRSGPSLNGRVNLYAWGAIESSIERDKFKEGFFRHKLDETREVVGQDIGQLYLTALRAKEYIAVYKESLERHNKLIEDLNVIVTYDPGRQSEMNEALSRRNQVESTILQQERTMHNALSRLSRYTYSPVTVQDLSDPFANVSAAQFIAKFSNPDVKTHPTYLAQQKEAESARMDVDVVKASRLPAINLEGSVSRHEREVYLAVNWDLYNPASKYEERKSFYSHKATEARLQEIELQVTERAQTAQEDMLRNEQLAKVTHRQIELQRNVVKDTELQFQIATKSLFNVLDAYQQLHNVQASEIAARNDFRDAALSYLVSQARVANWAGVAVKGTDEEN